jgi:hypothetical protein
MAAIVWRRQTGAIRTEDDGLRRTVGFGDDGEADLVAYGPGGTGSRAELWFEANDLQVAEQLGGGVVVTAGG